MSNPFDPGNPNSPGGPPPGASPSQAPQPGGPAWGPNPQGGAWTPPPGTAWGPAQAGPPQAGPPQAGYPQAGYPQAGPGQIPPGYMGSGPPQGGPPWGSPPGWGPQQRPPFGQQPFGQQPFGQQPFGQQPWPQMGYFPNAARVPSGPSSGPGIAALLGGFLVGSIATPLWVSESHSGYGASLVAALFMAAAVWGVVWGGARIATKKLPKAVHFGILGGVAVLATALGPVTSRAHYTSKESSLYTELSRSTTSSFEWSRYEREIPADFRRDAWRNDFMLAKVREAKGNAKMLRDVQLSISTEPEPKLVKGARDEAHKQLESLYDAGKARLYRAPTTGAAPEFPVDAKLRDAFGTVLEQLADSTDPNVYVSFGSASNLDAPKGTDENLKELRSDPELSQAFPRHDIPVIEAGSAFSPEFDKRRRGTFISAMGESFSKVFDSQLISLVPLETGTDRKKKIVIEVSSKISRQSDFFIYSTEPYPGAPKKPAGLLFGIGVQWTFKIIGNDGKVLYEAAPTTSQSAEDVHINRDEGDPQWALYSIMMDSAYYNYSREVVGRFGFDPPPIKDTFSYSGAPSAGGPTPGAKPGLPSNPY